MQFYSFFLVVFFSQFLIVPPSFGYPPDSCAKELNSTDSTAMIKTYLSANLMFPQISSAVLSSLVAYYLTNEIRSEQVKQNLNDEDTFLLIVNAMNSSHNSYGIRPIQEEELRSLIRSFSQWRFNMALNMTLQLLSESPRQYMTLNSTDIENNFYLQSRFKQQIQRSKEYGETILDTFRSKKAIELSKSYRMEFKSLQERTSESYAWVREKSQISQKLQDLVVNQLRQEHPELNTTIKSWNSKNFKAPKTLAEVLWMAMSQPRSLYSWSSN